MSSNVGLSTPRGSGTSGYVQRNLSLLKPRSTGAGAPYSLDTARAPKPRKPDQAILAHDRARAIEVQVLERRDELEDKGDVDDDEIDAACDQLRAKLLDEQSRKPDHGAKGARDRGRGLKGYQVHELAEAKAVESEKLRRALGLKSVGRGGSGAENDGDDRDAVEDEHPMARQERRKRERDVERVNQEMEREERHGHRSNVRHDDDSEREDHPRDTVRERGRDRDR